MNSKKDANNKGIIGLPYYTRRRYALLRSVAADADEMFESWDEWYREREKLETNLKASGYKCKDIEVDIKKLVLYCQERNLDNISANRTKYLQYLILGKD